MTGGESCDPKATCCAAALRVETWSAAAGAGERQEDSAPAPLGSRRLALLWPRETEPGSCPSELREGLSLFEAARVIRRGKTVAHKPMRSHPDGGNSHTFVKTENDKSIADIFWGAPQPCQSLPPPPRILTRPKPGTRVHMCGHTCTHVRANTRTHTP